MAITEEDAGVVVCCRVVPRASRDALAVGADGVLRVRLQAPPVEGKANKALLKFLAKTLAVRANQLSLLGGAKSRIKRIGVRGLSATEVRARLGL